MSYEEEFCFKANRGYRKDNASGNVLSVNEEHLKHDKGEGQHGDKEDEGYGGQEH